MIKSKNDYLNYLEEDRIALNKNNSYYNLIKRLFFPDYIWGFQKSLRKLEYYNNCKKGIIENFYFIFLKMKFRKRSLKLGFSIPINVFGPGLAIVHYGTLVVNPNAKVGRNCRIHPCTSIGASGGNSEAPQIGDNVYIGPGAKIYGSIRLGNNIAIAANTSVNKSFMENNIMIAGSPAKKIKSINIINVLPHTVEY